MKRILSLLQSYKKTKNLLKKYKKKSQKFMEFFKIAINFFSIKIQKQLYFLLTNLIYINNKKK